MKRLIGALGATLWLGVAAVASAQQAPAPPASAPAATAIAAPAAAGTVSSVLDSLSAAVGAGRAQPDLGAAAREEAARQKSQPLNNAPVWRETRSGANFSTTAQGPEAGVLIEPGGEQWRQLRPAMLAGAGGLIGLMLAATVGFYFWRGAMGKEGGERGRLIERFSATDRVAHWLLAVTFVLLGVTGLIMALGKAVLLPLLGHVIFGWIAAIAKNVHNFAGPVLVVAIPLFFFVYVRDNFIKRHDIRWFLRTGGMFSASGEEVPSGRFNAGEKGMFWMMVVVAGLTLVASGFVLLFPAFEQTRALMRLALMVHLCAAAIGLTFAVGHIYMGTVGMRGAYAAMRTGLVDEAWAHEHHALWYGEVKAGRSRQRFVDEARAQDRSADSSPVAGSAS